MRDLVRRFVNSCVKCRRQRAESLQQLMSTLPKERITSQRAFLTTGIDYAGPILLKTGRGRGTRNEKAWLALFVCFAVKAVHIELVSSLSTEVFLAAPKRFVSRRGKPSKIYSDNVVQRSKDHNERVSESVHHDEIEWHFAPQRGSHFGGLWEAGVKSVKTINASLY
ncbi:uncharacterized protein LOC114575668 [Exaiptasia diaphana]|uniref:Integrase zinc-binding domain-containing protein n=1 Tax=Exaiptasia diaphana TaxID=2652724 RepID=A0A913YP43_EXADI|nr:uncharacterized protein LOC114575668 [Exaiptasia diaphana]